MSHVLGPRLDALTAARGDAARPARVCALPGLPGVPPDAAEPLRLAELCERLETFEPVSLPMDDCDCTKTTCPHITGARRDFLASLGTRLEHLALLADAYPADVPTVRKQLRTAAVDCVGPNCRLRRHVDALFGTENTTNTTEADLGSVETVSSAPVETAVETSSARCQCLAKVCVGVSFGSNVGLCGAKLVAYALSGSMALLASLVDSFLDVLSGIVLVVCARLARGGFRCRCRRRRNQENNAAYPLGRRRYETLGVLAFACAMGTFALTLAYESVLRIVELVKQAKQTAETTTETTTNQTITTQYGPLQMGVVGTTIVLKIVLCVACHVTGRRLGRTDALRETLFAYRDDHRNDALSNAVGFVAGFVGARFNGERFNGQSNNLAWVDPAGSLLLSCYIFVSWFAAAIAQVRLLVGKAVAPIEMARVVLHAMHFDYRVEHVNRAAVYRCGRDATVELALCLPDALQIADGHRLVHALVDVVEGLEGIERCHIHLESDDCVNPP